MNDELGFNDLIVALIFLFLLLTPLHFVRKCFPFHTWRDKRGKPLHPVNELFIQPYFWFISIGCVWIVHEIGVMPTTPQSTESNNVTLCNLMYKASDAYPNLNITEPIDVNGVLIGPYLLWFVYFAPGVCVLSTAILVCHVVWLVRERFKKFKTLSPSEPFRLTLYILLLPSFCTLMALKALSRLLELMSGSALERCLGPLLEKDLCNKGTWEEMKFDFFYRAGADMQFGILCQYLTVCAFGLLCVQYTRNTRAFNPDFSVHRAQWRPDRQPFLSRLLFMKRPDDETIDVTMAVNKILSDPIKCHINPIINFKKLLGAVAAGAAEAGASKEAAAAAEAASWGKGILTIFNVEDGKLHQGSIDSHMFFGLIAKTKDINLKYMVSSRADYMWGLHWAGMLGVWVYFIVGMVHSFALTTCDFSHNDPDAYFCKLEDSLSPLMSFLTLLCVVNMFVITQVRDLVRDPPNGLGCNASTKFLALRLLLIVGSIQPKVLTYLMHSQPGSESDVAMDKFGMAWADAWLRKESSHSQYQVAMWHAALLVYEALLVIIINLAAWKGSPPVDNEMEVREVANVGKGRHNDKYAPSEDFTIDSATSRIHTKKDARNLYVQEDWKVKLLDGEPFEYAKWVKLETEKEFYTITIVLPRGWKPDAPPKLRRSWSEPVGRSWTEPREANSNIEPLLVSNRRIPSSPV